MERKTKALMISTILILAALSGVAFMAYGNGTTIGTAATETDTTNSTCICGFRGFGGEGFGRHGGRGWGPGGFVSVSEAYKENVTNIAKNDSDVQQLLADGYNITGVRPIISTMVEADGSVTMKATTAVVALCQNSTGRAFVWVDLEQAKVTRIEILTRTIIEKP
jgi:hypothetical protein